MSKVIAAQFFLIAAFLGATTPAVYGEDFCLELARRGLFNSYAGKTFHWSYDESREDFCRKWNTTRRDSTGLFAAYRGLDLNFTDSEEEARVELMCDNTYSLASAIDASSESKSVLSDQAVRVVEACVNRSGVRLDGSFAGKDRFTINMSYVPPTGAKGAAVFTSDIDISGSVVCRGPLREVEEGTPLENQAIGMVCERTTSRPEVKDGPYGRYRIERGGSVTVFTNVDTYSIDLPPKINEPKCSPQTVELTPTTLRGLCVGCLGSNYGPVVTDTLAASRSGKAMLRILEYVVDLDSCGDYLLSFSYTSPDRRSVRLSVDGVTVKKAALGEDTGTAAFSGQKEKKVLVLSLRSGHHVIRLERQGRFPHVGGARLYPYRFTGH